MDALNYRNPLFAPDTFCSPALTMVLDILHILYLGVHARLISAILWEVIGLNPFGASGGQDVIAEITLERLSEQLNQWYVANEVPRNYR
eukprot:6695086-Pyramimonas_sp.AAC.1